MRSRGLVLVGTWVVREHSNLCYIVAWCYISKVTLKVFILFSLLIINKELKVIKLLKTYLLSMGKKSNLSP